MTLPLDWTGNVRQGTNVTGRGWKRVADLVVATRLKLGYSTRPTFAAAAGIALRTLDTLERGNPVSPRILRKVETGLGMDAGYLDDVRDEGDTAPLSPPADAAPALTAVPPLDDSDTTGNSTTPPRDILQRRLHEPMVDENGRPIRDRYGDVMTPARYFSFLEHVLMYSKDGVPSMQRAIYKAAPQFGLRMEDQD